MKMKCENRRLGTGSFATFLFTSFVLGALFISIVTPSTSFADFKKKEPNKSAKSCANSNFTKFKIDDLIIKPPAQSFFICDNSLLCCEKLSIDYFQQIPDEFHAKRKSGYPFSISLTITRTSPSFKAMDTYNAHIKDGKVSVNYPKYQKSFVVKDMPLQDGFYVVSLSEYGGLLVAADPKFKTPQGNPVIFDCEFYQGNSDKYNCSTQIAISTEGMLILRNISAYIPKENFMKVYNYALDQYANMIVNDSELK